VEADRFYLGTQVFPGQALTVVCGGRERCQAGYRIDRADFPYHSIEFVARGRGHIRLDTADHPLTPGSVFSYGPGVPHVITMDANDPLVKYFVDLAGTDAGRLLAEYGPDRGRVLQVTSPEAVLRIFDDLVATGRSDTRYTPLLCAAIARQLLYKVAETSVDRQVRTTAAFATFQTCKEFIRDHHLTIRGLDEVGERCGVDTAYLCRLFKRFDDQSPYQYLLRLKMNAAAHRLQAPGAMVKQVAHELGFRDPFHFSRAFKKVFGLPPDHFRKLR
jgi:AraC-like DNA-binding protein